MAERPFACSVHPHLPAAAYCTECRRPYNGRFLSVLPDGRAVCYRCVVDQRLRTIAEEDLSTDDPAFGQGFFQAGVRAVRDPRRILGTEEYTGPIRRAVLFGFFMCILGAVLPMVIPAIFAPEVIQEVLQRTFGERQPDLTPQQQQRAFLLSLPVFALMKLMLGSSLLHVGLRLAGARSGSFREHVRVFALCSSVLVFAIIPPPFGIMVMSLLWGSAMMKWVNGRYGLSAMMGMVAVFPALLVMVVL